MPTILTRYKKNSIRNDTVLSILMAAILWSIGPYLTQMSSPEFNPAQLVATMISVMAQFASISIASLAIVAGFVDSKYLDEVRRMEWFPDVWRFLAITGSVFVAGISLGLMTLFFGVENYVALGFLAVSLFLFVQVYRCIRLLYLLISIINQHRKQSA